MDVSAVYAAIEVRIGRCQTVVIRVRGGGAGRLKYEA